MCVAVAPHQRRGADGVRPAGRRRSSCWRSATPAAHTNVTQLGGCIGLATAVAAVVCLVRGGHQRDVRRTVRAPVRAARSAERHGLIRDDHMAHTRSHARASELEELLESSASSRRRSSPSRRCYATRRSTRRREATGRAGGSARRGAAGLVHAVGHGARRLRTRRSTSGSSAASSTRRTTAWTATSRPASGERVAFHWRGEEGEERDVTYADLHRDVQRFANALKEPRRRQGRRRRDLPADDPRGRRRDARLRADRRAAQRRLRRLQRRGGARADGVLARPRR